MSDELEFDVEGQIEYWRSLVNKDLTIAENLIVRDSETAYGLFFVHMALEKIIKAHVVKQTKVFRQRIIICWHWRILEGWGCRRSNLIFAAR